jgi:hypothetical protein
VVDEEHRDLDEGVIDPAESPGFDIHDCSPGAWIE